MVDIVRLSSFNTLNTSTGTRVTTGQNNPINGTSQTDTDKERAEELQTQFLQILLTQLQNQNPMDPMDTKEFTGQLAQFSSLEQQISTNAKLDSLVKSVQASSASSAFGYIGQVAEVDSNLTIVEGDTADWKYALSSPAETLNIKIKDQQGRVVYEKNESNIQSGTYSLNAKLEDFTSTIQPGQILKLEITGKDKTNKPISTQISTTMKVDGVETTPDGIDLRSGGLIYSLADVKRFSSAPTAPNNGNSNV